MKFKKNYHICHDLRDFHNRNLHDLDWPLKYAEGKCKYANRKPIHDFLYDGDYDIFLICHRLRYIHDQNVHDLDLEL